VSVIDPSTGELWVPAFEGQRPPFQPGNTLSVGNKGPLTHGAYSAKRTDPLANYFRDEILAEPGMDYLTRGQYAALFWQYCRTAARIQTIEEAIDGMPIDAAARSDKGQTSWLELLRKWTATLTTLASRCGLDPLSYARLGKDVAATQVDLATLLSKPAKDDPAG
jgi:hypothetical protein